MGGWRRRIHQTKKAAACSSFGHRLRPCFKREAAAYYQSRAIGIFMSDWPQHRAASPAGRLESIQAGKSTLTRLVGMFFRRALDSIDEIAHVLTGVELLIEFMCFHSFQSPVSGLGGRDRMSRPP